MAYKVVNLRDYRAKRTGNGPGRPPKYSEDTVSVSFRVPKTIVKMGRRKARNHEINMTELLMYQYVQFVARPIEDTLNLLTYYRATYGVLEEPR
jgi:hypothetical protein